METIRCFEIIDLNLLQPYFTDKSIIKELGIVPKHKDNRRWLVAMSDDRIAGFVGIDPIKNCLFPFRGEGVQLKHFYVLPDYRCQGIGSKLLTKVIDLCKCNIKATILSNTIGFYERHGFIQHGNNGQYPIVARLT
jgi:GNAT superfamily N-acetyltransferase